MKKIKVNLHSSVDVITNSSTVIYTYQDGSEGPVRKLIEEIFKLAGIEKSVDDIFEFTVESDGYNDDLDCDMNSILYITVKDDKYKGIADKIESILNSVGADGGRDG